MKFLKKPSKWKRIIQNQTLISFWYIFKKHGFFLKELKNRWKKIAIFFQYFFFEFFNNKKINTCPKKTRNIQNKILSSYWDISKNMVFSQKLERIAGKKMCDLFFNTYFFFIFFTENVLKLFSRESERILKKYCVVFDIFPKNMVFLKKSKKIARKKMLIFFFNILI